MLPERTAKLKLEISFQLEGELFLFEVSVPYALQTERRERINEDYDDEGKSSRH
jgi:hypothetical protein